jgi:flagellar basal-body rod protein FlgB
MNKLDQALQFQQVALSLRAQRQQVLAANIANADTPNYKARDFDFQAAMAKALVSQPKPGLTAPASNGPAMSTPLMPAPASAAPAMLMTAAAHLPGKSIGNSAGSTSTGIPLQYRSVVQGSLDNNSVDMDQERNQFADNAVRYEASVTMLNAQLKQLNSAING